MCSLSPQERTTELVDTSGRLSAAEVELRRFQDQQQAHERERAAAALEAHGLRERAGALERALAGAQATLQDFPQVAQLQADYQALVSRCQDAEMGASVSAVQAADARSQLDESERAAADARDGAAQMHAALVDVESRLREAHDREAEVAARVREATEEAQAMMLARDQLILREARGAASGLFRLSFLQALLSACAVRGHTPVLSFPLSC